MEANILADIKRTEPKLWIECLRLYKSVEHKDLMREVTLRKGLNIIWAKEPEEISLQRELSAGHGVGKTSFCLLLRYCLGDSATSVKELCNDLADNFPDGAVLAVIHLDGKPWTILRYFSAYKEGRVCEGYCLDTLLLGHEVTETYTSFANTLEKNLFDGVASQIIPQTEQVLTLRHLLSWLARDQSARFTGYYRWREGEGTGLQRSKQDPPHLLRTMLGLYNTRQDELSRQYVAAENKVKQIHAKQASRELESKAVLKRIEADIRRVLKQPDLTLKDDDLFQPSVLTLLDEQLKTLLTNLDDVQQQLQQHQEGVYSFLNEKQELKSELGRCKAQKGMAEASLSGSLDSYLEFEKQYKEIMSPVGSCRYGNIAYTKCEHITKRVETMSFQEAQLKKALRGEQARFEREVTAWSDKVNTLQKELDQASKQLADYRRRSVPINTKLVECAWAIHDLKRLKEELANWEAKSIPVEASSELAKLNQLLNNTMLKLQQEQAHQSQIKLKLQELFDLLTHLVISEHISGIFQPQDEDKPFVLAVRGGEAYRVLEVLLGDITVMLSWGLGIGHFPSFIIHDCPREADMSAMLYEQLLNVLYELEQELTIQPPFQYIVTTTTPPPLALQSSPYLRLELSPDKLSGMLFGMVLDG